MKSENDTAEANHASMWTVTSVFAGLAIGSMIGTRSLNASTAPLGVMFVVVLLLAKTPKSRTLGVASVGALLAAALARYFLPT